MTVNPASRSIFSTLALALLAGAAAPRLSGQCANAWRPGFGIPGTNNDVYATTIWDPDGAGPATPLVVFGGKFDVAGTVDSTVAAWDPSTGVWTALPGIRVLWGSSVRTLLAGPNGELFAGGQMSFANGANLGRWDGAQWQPIGAGVPGPTLALKVLPNGDLLAGGGFTGFVSRWDGSAWTRLGTFDSTVWCVDTLANGDVVVGGDFTTVDSVSASHIARWDGVTWSPLGVGTDRSVYALSVQPNGDLVAGGFFVSAGGSPASHIARWDGSTWFALGSGTDNTVSQITIEPSGDLLVCGAFTTAGSASANRVARWNGTAWSAVGNGLDNWVYSASRLANGDLVVGGTFTGVGFRLARWNGSTWSAIGSGMNAGVSALAPLPDGTYLAGGAFTTAGTTSARNVARWTGSDWAALGGGPPLTGVSALTTLPGGDVLAAGGNGIARFDGASWTSLAAANSSVSSLLLLPDGNLIAGGRFTLIAGVAANFIAQWDGTNWAPLGSGMNNGINAVITAIARLPNGDLVATGSFANAGGASALNIARWDGTTWTPLGAGLDQPGLALAVLPNGDLVAGGSFLTAGGIPARFVARWDGAVWSPLAGLNSSVYALAVLPDGSLIAGVLSSQSLFRWNGTSWSAVQPNLATTSVAVTELAVLTNGDVVAGGTFTGGGHAYVAQLTTTCPATAAPYGAGCASSVGTMILGADALPWIGGTFRSTATAMATSSVGLSLLGLSSPGVPLSLLHPAAGPGCDLLASLDVTLPLLPSNGRAVTQVNIPLDPIFVGAVLRHQMLQVELDQSLNITLLSSSNGLTLAIGSF